MCNVLGERLGVDDMITMLQWNCLILYGVIV